MSLYDYFNSFSRYIEEERPSDKAIVLYWAMLDMFNRRGWPEWTAADRQEMMVMCNTTNRRIMDKARTVLCQAGFLEYKPGEKKGQASRYRLLIPERRWGNRGANLPPESTPESAPKNDLREHNRGADLPPESAPQNDVILYKTKTKTKTKTLSSSSSTTTSEERPEGRLPPEEKADPDLERVMTEFLSFLPGASKSSRKKMENYCRALGPEVCLLAIETARDAEPICKNKLAYLCGVLQNRERAGIRSKADWDAHEQEREWRRQHGNGQWGQWDGQSGRSAVPYGNDGANAGEAEASSADEEWGIRSAF